LSGLGPQLAAGEAVPRFDLWFELGWYVLTGYENGSTCSLSCLSTARHIEQLRCRANRQPVEWVREDHQLGIECERTSECGSPSHLVCRIGWTKVRGVTDPELCQHDANTASDLALREVTAVLQRQGNVVTQREILQETVTGGKVSHAPAESEQ
jgi:hypothetical protein